MKGKDRSRTRGGTDTREEEVFRPVKYIALASERPHPLKKVPGIRHCYWDSFIGRWVKV